eukprot:2749624-Rhodomonas_salina.1
MRTYYMRSATLDANSADRARRLCAELTWLNNPMDSASSTATSVSVLWGKAGAVQRGVLPAAHEPFLPFPGSSSAYVSRRHRAANAREGRHYLVQQG